MESPESYKLIDRINTEDEWKKYLQHLIHFFVTNNEKIIKSSLETNDIYRGINRIVLELFQKDYENVFCISNSKGHLCPTYPREIIVVSDDPEYRDKIQKAAYKSKFARVRSRFPVPVIHFHGKTLYRSGTLSEKIEIFAKSTPVLKGSTNFDMSIYLEDDESDQQDDIDIKPPSVLEKTRRYDINLLNLYNISRICDLMLEESRKILGFNVFSSEKSDCFGWYSQYDISLMPYPGAEYFKKFVQSRPENLLGSVFEWKDIKFFNLSHEKIEFPYNVLRTWDVITLTKNYLKYLLCLLCDSSEKNVLIHCISGWDRTPLFVSLVRLSLWADGKIHQNLNSSQMLYLTLGYDWLLFNHQLAHRQKRGEDIFGFCFHFLEHITTEDFSVDYIEKVIKNEEDYKGLFDQLRDNDEVLYEDVQQTNTFNVSERRKKLLDEVRTKFNDIYDTHMKPYIPKPSLFSWLPF